MDDEKGRILNAVTLTSKDRERKRPFAKQDDNTPVACVALSFLHCVSQLGHTRLHRTLLVITFIITHCCYKEMFYYRNLIWKLVQLVRTPGQARPDLEVW